MSIRPLSLTLKSFFQKIYKTKNINKIRNSKDSFSSNTIKIIAPTPPTAIPLREIIINLPKLFPRSIRESLSDYKLYKGDSGKIQDDLLATLKYYPNDASGLTESRVIKTDVDNEGNYINEFCVKPKNIEDPKKLKHLIFIHGYGAGLGFFIKNLENLPFVDENWCIHAIDLPGFGFSSRAKFPFSYPTDDASKVHEWFHVRIRTWFEKRSLLNNPENNVVMAHSLGAYLMALYNRRYPEDFRKLIMCSPAGICQSKLMHKNPPPWWYIKLWDLNLSPFSLVRNTSFLGSKLTSGWSYRRFKLIETEEQFEALHKYSYAIFNRPGSGEYLLGFALRCGGDPRVSLEECLFQNTKSKMNTFCEWTWIYGERDWMDIEGGKRATHYITSMNGKSRVITVPNAGHHLYFDNYSYFNSIIANEMKNL